MIRFVTLMNDITEEEGFKTEHGLSFWITFKNQSILFDMGQSLGFYDNMKKLNLDLNQVDYLLLSHGHYDHTGGIGLLNQLNSTCEIHVGKNFWDRKYKKESDGYRYNGIPDVADINKGIFKEQEDVVKKIGEDIYTVSHFYNDGEGRSESTKFCKEVNGLMKPDFFEDEIALCFDTSQGIVVFVGCSHPGIVRMLETIRTVFSKPIYAVVGGFHLRSDSEEKIQNVATYFKTHVAKAGTGHCSGKNAEDALKAIYKDDFMELLVGKYHRI